MKASRMVTAAVAAALVTAAAGAALVTAAAGAALVTGGVTASGQGFPTQGSQVINAADAPRDASTGLSTGRRQY